MSEQTGATDQQMSEAELRFLRYLYPHVLEEVLQGFNPNDELLSLRMAAKFIVPPGSKIVPADAVVVTPEIAAVAAEACVSSSRRFHKGAVRSEKAGNDLHSEEMHKIAARYQAAAAALRGEG